MDIALVWAGLIAVAVLMYVILDGFDLGVGILFPFFRDEEERDLMINTVAPVWDGNETWLVLGGGGLFAVFPLAYALILPALYAPLTAMLLGLIFRGVAFEYRWRTKRGKPFWDFAFFAGSTTAAFAQGIALGALVQGIEVEGRAYAGGWWDWAVAGNGFSIFTGFALVTGYALLGSTWLHMKTTGNIQWKARQYAYITAAATLVLIGIVSLWTPFQDPVYFHRWFDWPTVLFSGVVPALLFLCAYFMYRGLQRFDDYTPFFAALAIFVLCFIGIVISFYPFMVPPTKTIWDVAAPPESQGFLLVGTVVLLPMVLGYTAYAYWVFRGKTRAEEGYH